MQRSSPITSPGGLSCWAFSSNPHSHKDPTSAISKYRNRKTEYNGALYDSKREAEYARDLDLRLRAKDIKAWQRQVSLRLVVHGKFICRNVVDFEILHSDGSVEFVEVKGFETRDWKLKRRLVEALYPDIKYTVIK